MPFVSPVDVQLDEDDRTVVQPDVLIVCDRSKFQNGRVFGAPDFVVEVLSPSTSKKDSRLKLYKYGEAGVREYCFSYHFTTETILYIIFLNRSFKSSTLASFGLPGAHASSCADSARN